MVEDVINNLRTQIEILEELNDEKANRLSRIHELTEELLASEDIEFALNVLSKTDDTPTIRATTKKLRNVRESIIDISMVSNI